MEELERGINLKTYRRMVETSNRYMINIIDNMLIELREVQGILASIENGSTEHEVMGKLNDAEYIIDNLIDELI